MYPERIVPDREDAGIVASHAKRYEFALPFCNQKNVLDAGCGVGYGSALLAAAAQRVLGVDVSDEAIAYARSRYVDARVSFEQMDLLALDLPSESFDAACCFETLEHLDEPDRAVSELARVLSHDGVLVASTPRVERTTRSPANPFHRLELSRADFEGLLRSHFDDVELYGQRREQTTRHRAARHLDVFGLRRRLPVLRRLAGLLVGTPALEHASAGDFVIERNDLDRATELVAVCHRPRLP